MNYTESILVLSSLLFGTILYVLTLVKGPGITIFAGRSYVDIARLPKLIKFLLVIFVVSVLIGCLVARTATMALQYAGLNLLIGTIMGTSLLLVRQHSDDPLSKK